MGSVCSHVAALLFKLESCTDIVNYNSETDTDEEDDDVSNSKIIPEPLTFLYVPSAVDFEEDRFKLYSKNLYMEYKDDQNQMMYNNLEQVTEIQSQSKAWRFHRVGRITASVAKLAYQTKLDNSFPKTLIYPIMKYNPDVNTAATK